MTKTTQERYISYCKYIRLISFIGITTIVISLTIGGFILADYINAWEIANNYPFGKLCDVFNNCSSGL